MIDFSEIPPQTYLVLGGVLVVVILMYSLRAGLKHRSARRHPELGLGALSRRLVLPIAEGDASFNLYTAWQNHSDKGYRGLGVGRKETRVRLAGAPYGRASEFVYHISSTMRAGVFNDTERTSFEWRLSVAVPVAFPDFEIVLRTSEDHLAPGSRLPAPRQLFGDPALDQRLELTSLMAGIGPVLAPAAAALLPMGQVHVRGAGGAVHSLATWTGAFVAMRELPQTQQVLENMATLLTEASRQQAR